MTEQEKATAEAPPKSPLVKVEKGNPTPEQLAVITAVIAAKAAGGGGPATPPTRDEWGRPADRLRPHWASATSFSTHLW